MCGIIGFSGMFKPSALNAGLHALHHRGPDDSGLYLNEIEGVGLAHSRLSILDLSPRGHQPMLAVDGKVAIVFNGEIYNFRELRQELRTKGYSFRSDSDTEVLLNLYLAQGEAMLTRLNGIFTFALWDERKHSLFIARDALGVKPIYFARCPQGIAFASEIKALLPLLPQKQELDVKSLHRYLSFLWCPGDGTPFKTVRKLQAGEAIIVRQGEIERHWSWYELPSLSTTKYNVLKDECISGVTSHLRQAVHRQMLADVPVGAFLSGGLDSSALVAFAREQNPEIQCFTIEMAGGQDASIADDLPYAHLVAKHLGVSLDVVTIDSEKMAYNLVGMVEQLDEPLADPAALNVLYISQLARQCGIKVLLSGAGGDDLFSGYRRHQALFFEKWWHWLPAKIRSRLDMQTSKLDQRFTWSRRLSKLLSGAGLNGDARIANYFMWGREADLLSLYSTEARDQLDDELAIQPLIDFLAAAPEEINPIERMLLMEQRFFLTDHNLLYTDKMSMAAGVETRVPFLDLDLVKFAASIPPQYKQRGTTSKWVLKEAIKPYLPQDVIHRPKTGFGAPLRRWMQHELRDLFGDFLSHESLKRRGLFDPVAIQKLIADNATGRIDANYTLLSLLCIEIWCRRFAD